MGFNEGGGLGGAKVVLNGKILEHIINFHYVGVNVAVTGSGGKGSKNFWV